MTPRGFTGHEMLDDLGLVHMNGRIYDPLLGRFLSADLMVQYPTDLQSYNRYSYVRNNPLSLIDPTGFMDGTTATLEVFAAGTAAILSPGATVIAAPVVLVGSIGYVAFKDGVPPGSTMGASVDPYAALALNQQAAMTHTKAPDLANAGKINAQLADRKATNAADQQDTKPKPPVDKAKVQENSSGGQIDPEKGPGDKDQKNKEKMAEVRAKGKEGEEQQQTKITAEGETTTGKQVTFETSTGSRAKIDKTTTDGQKQIVREAKKGETARLSPGQKDLKNDVDKGNPVIPRGENARKAGYTPDKPTTLDEFKEDRFP